jgi:uncharacterized protein YecT (DUF1311 family)
MTINANINRNNLVRLALFMSLLFYPVLINGSSASAVPYSEIEKRHTKAYDECLNNGDAARGVQPAMNACVAMEYERQDGRLNQAYSMVMKRQNAAGKTKLRAAQRIWIKQRDRICAAEEKEYEGGTMAPMIFHSCLINETIERTIWLEKYR